MNPTCKTCGAFFVVVVPGQKYCCSDCSPTKRAKQASPQHVTTIELPQGTVWMKGKDRRFHIGERPAKRSKKYKNEAEFQRSLASRLSQCGIPYHREVEIPNTKQRVDFYAKGFGIEAKLECNAGEAQRLIGQLTINLTVGGVNTFAVVPDDTNIPTEASKALSASGFFIVRESNLVEFLQSCQ